jgi:hypothetical protein
LLEKNIDTHSMFCQGGWEGWSRFVTGKGKFIGRKIEEKGRFVGLGFRQNRHHYSKDLVIQWWGAHLREWEWGKKGCCNF